LVAALAPIVAKISRLTREIAHRVRAHPDGHIFLSLFRDPNSVVCAAALLAKIVTAAPATAAPKPWPPTPA
jgi:hypothetical protein